MNVLLIEDEAPAAARLRKLLQQRGARVLAHADSIEASVRLLAEASDIDLIFMDIQLADGLCFEIFQQTEVRPPVVFTTAYDQYTLKAFKVNSIDYLLKPIDESELTAALAKFRRLDETRAPQLPDLAPLLAGLQKPRYRERLLIRKGSQFLPVKTAAIAYCYADDKLCFAVEASGARHLLDDTLSRLEEELDPAQFYRINRHMIVQLDAIRKVHSWLGARLRLELHPESKQDTIVSREKVTAFKEWLGGH